MSEPLAAGSVSLRIYPHDLDAESIVEELCAQARIAEAAGFDGLMTSEHHGGFRAYLPNPLLVASFLLDCTETLWAAPCPLLLPLRHWTQTAEDLAWLAARHHGRVGAGFAAGGLDRDFEMAELPFEENMTRFKRALPAIVEALRGRAPAPLADDLAIARCAVSPIPTTSAAMSPAAARRAGALGIGILCDSLQTPKRLREIARAHRDGLAAAKERGGAARTLIRRVWVGAPPSDDVEAQMNFYKGYAAKAAQAHWGGQELIAAESAEEVADGLARVLEQSDCEALNLRVHTHGVDPVRTREQIDRVGREVLPQLRDRLS